MHNPTYKPSGARNTVAGGVSYQQGRARELASIARTFLFNGNKREAVRFQQLSASAAENAREGLFAL